MLCLTPFNHQVSAGVAPPLESITVFVAGFAVNRGSVFDSGITLITFTVLSFLSHFFTNHVWRRFTRWRRWTDGDHSRSLARSLLDRHQFILWWKGSGSSTTGFFRWIHSNVCSRNRRRFIDNWVTGRGHSFFRRSWNPSSLCLEVWTDLHV